MEKSFLMMMYICHCMGDYYLQTSRIAANKVYSYKYTAIHSALYGISFAFAAALWGFTPGAVLAAFAAAGSHFLIDIAKCAWMRNAQTKHEKLIYILDQSLHIVILYFCGGCVMESMGALSLYGKYLGMVLYAAVVMQPAYITYEILFSTDSSADCMKGNKKYIFKSAAAVMGILLYFGLYPVIFAVVPAALVILVKKEQRIRREGLRMCAFIVCAGCVMFFLTN